MSQTKNPLEAFESRLVARKRIETIATTGLRPILRGGANFIRTLDVQIRLLDELHHQFTQFESHEADAGAPVRYEPQRQRLLAARRDLEALRNGALSILELAKGKDKAATYDEKQIEEIKDKYIKPLLREEQMRKYRELRIQGPMVEEKRHYAEKCNGMIAEAVIELVKMISKATSDPHSNSGLDALWRWIGHDGSIWLYHHSDYEKWKCMFFRIHVSRINENLIFSMESYVPFGLGDDPAQYQMDTSEVFLRPGWRTVEVTSANYSTMNTFNLQSSITRTDGVSLGTSVSTNISTSESESIGTTDTVGQGTHETVTAGDSWFDNWSETLGSSAGSQSGGGFSFNSSRGQSRGGGSGGSRSNSHGTSNNRTTGTNQSQTKGVTRGTGNTVQEGTQQSLARTSGAGLAHSSGEALQVKVMGCGIHLGLQNIEHLEKWKEANRDAARIYNNVQDMFVSMCKEVVEKVRGLDSGSGAYADGKLDARLGEIDSFFLVERPSTAMPADAILVRNPGGALNPSKPNA